MGVARVEEDVGDRDAERVGDPYAHLLGGALVPQREVDADERQVDPDHDDLRAPVAEDAARWP